MSHDLEAKFKRDLAQGSLARRKFLQMLAIGSGALVAPRMSFAQTMAGAPAGDPGNLRFVVWQYGNIYSQIAEKFRADWGVDLDAVIEPNVEPQVTKLATMFAAGDQVDVAQIAPGYLSNYIDEEVIEPLDGLPGFDSYKQDFTSLFDQYSSRGGKSWALPYFSGLWSFMYNEEMLDKAGFGGEPFQTYEQMAEQCLKAKADGLSEYPLLWVGGVGLEQLPGTWFTITHSAGGMMFDEEHNPLLGEGSKAREALAFWQSTFTEMKIADPDSLNLRFIPAVKAFNTGKYIYLGAQHHYYITAANDPAQSPIAGKVKFLGSPGRGIGFSLGYGVSSAYGDKEWAWNLLQYLGGRTKDGDYAQAYQLADDAMLGSGYNSVMASDQLASSWSKWADSAAILESWNNASNLETVVPAASARWYPQWIDAVNVEVTRCLQGNATPAETCDILEQRALELKAS